MGAMQLTLHVGVNGIFLFLFFYPFPLPLEDVQNTLNL
jgi:hypothetical protein